ncbi:MAG: hypothetical protein RRY34_06240 [Victivallaceae bacterium]
MRLVRCFGVAFCALMLNLTAADDSRTVLQKVAELSPSYDFETEDGVLYNDGVFDFTMLNYSNGRITRSVAADGTVLLRVDCQRPSGTKMRLLHNRQGNFVLVDLPEPEKFVIRMTSESQAYALVPLVELRFDALKAILSDTANLQITDFKEVEHNGRPSYQILVKLEPQHAAYRLMKKYKEISYYPSELELFVDKSNYFVYAWNTKFPGKGLEKNDLSSAKVYPGGSLSEKLFDFPPKLRICDADSINGYVEILCRRGRTPEEQEAYLAKQNDSAPSEAVSANSEQSASTPSAISDNSRLLGFAFAILGLAAVGAIVIILIRRGQK